MVRIGRVHYLNTLPLFYLWEARGVSFVEGHPSELVNLLRKGQLEAGIVSSLEYLKHPENYRLVRGLSISSTERACSVLIFSTKPLGEVNSVYLTPASLTSRALAIYLIRRVYKREPEWLEDRERAEALMLIGDEALQERLKGEWQYVYDLGEEWFRLYGLPFVFALFLVRKDAPKGLEFFIEEQCKKSKTSFFKDLKEGRLKVEKYGLFLKEYFTSCLDYNLDERGEESLRIFNEILISEGLLSNLGGE
ncbi:MAG: menaquinone biosynthesis protein [Aquificaceae bacterium]|nr:menaquinone biosynthesis protein [Aquificaceae bacterium]